MTRYWKPTKVTFSSFRRVHPHLRCETYEQFEMLKEAIDTFTMGDFSGIMSSRIRTYVFFILIFVTFNLIKKK